MKKYIIAVIAVVMVVIASAFMTGKSNSMQETTYWFLMDEAGTSVTTTQIEDPDELCPDKLEDPDCARLYNESQTEIVLGIRTVKTSEIGSYQDFRSKN
ncbi:MAG: hypothetical protein AB2L24_13350 [Mangrovibacterium sp.]